MNYTSLINLFYVLISLLTGVLCVIYIRSKDRFEKEPYLILLFVAVWGGIWSYIISGLLYDFLAYWGWFNFRNAWGAFFVIGPVEEFSKGFALVSVYVIIRKQLNEPVDGLLYMACVALGFSLIENYYYALDAPSGKGLVLILRILICTPAHINFSAIMGLAFYFWLQNRRAYPLVIAAFCYAVVVHGIYNLIIFKEYLIFLLAIAIWLMYKFSKMLLDYATAKSNFRYSLHFYLTTTPHKYLFTGPPCPICENKAVKSTWILLSKKIQKCDVCGHYLTTLAGFRAILHHFAAAPAKSFLGRPLIYKQPIKNQANQQYLVKNDDHNVLGFDLSVLNRHIEISNNKVIKRIESHLIFPKRWLHTKSFE